MSLYKKNWNALDSHQIMAGGTLPVLIRECNKRIFGARVTNVQPGEFVPAGTPFYFDLANRTATFYKETDEGSGPVGNVTPNCISIADCIGGTDTTMIDVPYGVIYMYKNTIAEIPESVLKSIKDAGDVQIVWELFNTAKE